MNAENFVMTVTATNEARDSVMVELLAMELAHVGGGIGDVILG